jgi:MFS family permease
MLEETASEGTVANRYRDYNLLFSSYALTLLGAGIAVVGLALLAFELAGDYANAVLGTAFAIKSAAYVVVAPVAAAIAGRLPKRSLLIALNLLRAAAVLLLPFVSEVWQLYLLILVFAAASAVYIPTYQSIVPQLLPGSEAYNRAVAKARVATELENALSPLVTAALLLKLDHSGLFVAVAAIFLLSAICLSWARIPPMRQSADVWGQIRRGLFLFRDTAQFRFLVPVNIVVALATAVVMVNTVVLVQGFLHLDERSTALALAAFGAGVLLGAVAMLPLVPRYGPRRTILLGAILTAMGLLGGTLISSFAGLLFIWFLLGCGSGLALTPAYVVLRQYGTAGDRGILYATHFSLMNAALLVSYPLAGWLGARFGLEMGFGVAAATAGLSLLAATYLWKP